MFLTSTGIGQATFPFPILISCSFILNLHFLIVHVFLSNSHSEDRTVLLLKLSYLFGIHITIFCKLDFLQILQICNRKYHIHNLICIAHSHLSSICLISLNLSLALLLELTRFPNLLTGQIF